jgi:hypothetical protein
MSTASGVEQVHAACKLQPSHWLWRLNVSIQASKWIQAKTHVINQPQNRNGRISYEFYTIKRKQTSFYCKYFETIYVCAEFLHFFKRPYKNYATDPAVKILVNFTL